MVVGFDLSDTLYYEIDFVKSGFWEVAKLISKETIITAEIIYEFMYRDFFINGGGSNFDKILSNLDLRMDIKKLIDIFRYHTSTIKLPDEAIDILEFLKSQKISTFIIADGDVKMQENKFNTLGLSRYIDYVIYTDEVKAPKPSPVAFKLIMDKFKSNEYIYIGDNPKKDFDAPKSLGWKTIRVNRKNSVFKELKNVADCEVSSLKDAINLI
jgi:putative hydrolase of the HAD superfamily